MKQVLQNLLKGGTQLAEVPAPLAEPGHLLIRTRRSLVSLGTEKMLVQFGKASLFQKARSQPAKVRQVLGKIRTDGLMPTVEAVFRKLDEPLPLGYCNAGTVIGVGEGVEGFAVGDRVASNGPHAEIVAVPINLVSKVPAGVSDQAAAFTVIGAIGLQGIRLARPELGETFVVIGLGLIGQLTAQLLKAHGCRVIGFDFDGAKVDLARSFGIEAVRAGGEVDPVKWVLSQTGGMGADAVLITASTSSNDVIRQSAQMSRKRGRIVLVGVVGLELNRADFYEKELTFQVSCSYGPGRYDDAYEEMGFDYPLAFVRWTENRNFQAVLAAIASGALKVEHLITKRVPLARFEEIYGQMDGSGLASILTYGPEAAAANVLTVSDRSFASGIGVVGIVGTGNFTKMTMLPALHASGAAIKYLCSASGVSGTHLAKKYGVPCSTTDFAVVLGDRDVRGVIIATRHNLHAPQVVAAVRAGKHVLVEKPLCLTKEELAEIEGALDAVPAASVTVGFNRRFSPHAQQIRELLGPTPAPLSLVATMNAGAIPLKHWVHDPEVGGGRLVGEACHFIDLAIFLTGSLVAAVTAVGLGGGDAPGGDTASVLLRHENGSTSVVNYLANGHREWPKERVEIFSQERVLVLDDFRETTGCGFRRFRRLKTKQDKGHAAQFAEFSRRLRYGGGPLIPWAELANGARATLVIGDALRSRAWVSVSAA
jgi:predicted dehydrogenase/threonine dehydrogenase-like Zn-dependent dehydrogenase